MTDRVPELPAAPLLRRLGDHTRLRQWKVIAPTERMRISHAVSQAREYHTFLMYDADLICCRLLQVHPSMVFGEQWWLADGPLPTLSASEVAELGPVPA